MAEVEPRRKATGGWFFDLIAIFVVSAESVREEFSEHPHGCVPASFYVGNGRNGMVDVEG